MAQLDKCLPPGEGAYEMGVRSVLRHILGIERPDKRPPTNSRFKNIKSSEALERFIEYRDIGTVLDIGSGMGTHAAILRESGKTVTCLSLIEPADVLVDYIDYEAPSRFDGIWASHVLEHTPVPGSFLQKCFRDLREDGILAVTVPPLKHGLAGGHVSFWNAGLLCYNLILAGFDCSEARIGSYGYNISVIVRKKPAELPADLHMDKGDIEKLAHLFPMPVAYMTDGRFPNLRW